MKIMATNYNNYNQNKTNNNNKPAFTSILKEENIAYKDIEKYYGPKVKSAFEKAVPNIKGLFDDSVEFFIKVGKILDNDIHVIAKKTMGTLPGHKKPTIITSSFEFPQFGPGSRTPIKKYNVIDAAENIFSDPKIKTKMEKFSEKERILKVRNYLKQKKIKQKQITF